MPTVKALGRVAVILLLLSQAAQIGLASRQEPPVAPATDYRAFNAAGKPMAIANIVEAFGAADVVLVGESHDDRIAHLLEVELLKRTHELYGSPSHTKSRPVALSLEMFERDVQLVVDEYLTGLISERHFLSSSRPWKNYQDDYRPLVEYARLRGLPVIAANTPARYVSRVAIKGPASLNELSKTAKAWLPAIPYPPASSAYSEKFTSFMSGSATPVRPALPTSAGSSPPSQTTAEPHAAVHLLDAQNLRDATMAFAIVEQLKKTAGALVIHVNGKFHSEERLGVSEHIKHLRPKTRVIIVTILSGEGFPSFDAARLGKLGDFVILTDAPLSR